MAKSTLMTMMCSAAVVLTAAGAVPEHFQPRAKELLADAIDLEQNAHKLNVIYFTGNDMAPTADASRRISELLVYLQQYYGKEMARNGFGKRSFGLSRTADGNVDIYYIQGKKAHKDYAYGTGHHACIEEVEAWFAAHPGKKMSSHTFIIMPTWQSDGYNDKNPGGVPFYGYGKYCFALDYADFDIKHLGKKTTEGKLLTKWYGGFAHELGHGMNLPHNNGTANQNRALGTPLMGSGNYTFGQSPTYLTEASCALLANTEIFVSAGNTVPFYTQTTPPTVYHAELVKRAGTLELLLELSMDVAQVNAYMQDPPYAVNQDYEAIAFACKMGTNKDGRKVAGVIIPLNDLAGLKNRKSGELGLDVLLQTQEGSRFRWRIPVDLSKAVDGLPIDTGAPTFLFGY